MILYKYGLNNDSDSNKRERAATRRGEELYEDKLRARRGPALRAGFLTNLKGTYQSLK